MNDIRYGDKYTNYNATHPTTIVFFVWKRRRVILSYAIPALQLSV